MALKLKENIIQNPVLKQNNLNEMKLWVKFF